MGREDWVSGLSASFSDSETLENWSQPRDSYTLGKTRKMQDAHAQGPHFKNYLEFQLL